MGALSKKVDMTARLRFILWSVAAVVALLLAFWGAYLFAYHRGYNSGYARGGRDEFLRWKQEPTGHGRDWDGMITGHRNMRDKATAMALRFSTWPVNAWSAPFSATGAVSVSAGGAPTK